MKWVNSFLLGGHGEGEIGDGGAGHMNRLPGYFGQASHVAGRPAFYSVDAEISPDPGAERDYSPRLYCHLLGSEWTEQEREGGREGGDIALLHLCSLIEKSRHKP